MGIPLVGLIGAFVGSSIGSAIVSKVLDTIFDSMIGDTPKSAIDMVKVRIARGLITGSMFDFMNIPIRGRPWVTSGLSDDTLIEWMTDSLELTTFLGMFVGNEVAEEMVMEMIQEAWSQSIQVSVGGTLVTIYGYWRGSYPPQQGEVDRIMLIWENLDRFLKIWLLASTGEHLYTLIYRILLGLKNKIDQEYTHISAQIPVLIEKRETLATWHSLQARDILGVYYTRAKTICLDSVDRLIIIGDSIVERALGRINEIEMDIDAHKRLYDREVVDGNTMIRVILQSILLLRATRESFTTMIDKIDNGITFIISNCNLQPLKEYTTKLLSEIWNKTYGFEGAITYNIPFDEIIEIIDTIDVIRQYASPTPTVSFKSTIVTAPPTAPPPEEGLILSANVTIDDEFCGRSAEDQTLGCLVQWS